MNNIEENGLLNNQDNRVETNKRNIQTVSILNEADTKVEKNDIIHIPDALHCVTEFEKSCVGFLGKGIDSSEKSNESCLDTENKIIEHLQEEASKEGIPFEEKRYYYEKMADAAIRKERKDTENKESLHKYANYGIGIFAIGLCFVLAISLRKTDIKNPLD